MEGGCRKHTGGEKKDARDSDPYLGPGPLTTEQQAPDAKG
jgi:hypothetical protein